MYALSPASAEAAFFDFIKPETAYAAQPEKNSQTIPLLQANLSPELSNVGGADVAIVDEQALAVDAGPLGTAADIEDFPSTDEITVYVVRDGDTISSVAKMLGISTNTLIWANDLKKGQALKDGDTLVVLPVSGVQYTVKKGDTLASIAKKLKGDIADIGLFNGITEDSTLTVGDTIIIPDGEMGTVETPKQAAKNTKTTKKKEKLSGTNGPRYDGYYIRPIDGGRQSQGLHGNNGVDLAVATGTPIHAAADGVVILSRSGGWGGGYGNYIVIKHNNGTQTLYAHNSKNLVSVGESVSQGQTIGLVGSTGHSTGPHVHFEVRGGKNPGANNSWASTH